MKWLDIKTTLYHNHAQRQGVAVTLREAIKVSDNVKQIVSRLHQTTDADSKRRLKEQLPCFTPSALIEGRNKVKQPTGLLQLDFDNLEGKGYDLNDLKNCLFKIPYVAYASRSCSGKGLFLLIAIAEPDKLAQYAEHLYSCFQQFGVDPDTSKGRNPTDLRYCSYDPDALIREDVMPLRVQHFRTLMPKRVTTFAPKTPPTEEDIKRVTRYVATIVKHEIDFAPTHDDWRSVAFSLAELGEAGRSLFHKVCQFSPVYDFDQSDDLFCRALSTRNGSAHIATFFKRCKVLAVQAIAEFSDFLT